MSRLPPASHQAPRRGRGLLRLLRRIGLLAIAALAIAALALRPRLETWLVDAATEALERQGLRLGVGGIELHLLRLRADVTDLVLERPTERPGRLRIAVPYVRLDLSWRSLVELRGGRIRLDRLLVDRPRVETDGALLRARAAPDARDEPLRLDVLVRHLRLTGGVWAHEDRETALDVDVSRAELRATLAGDGRTTTGDVRADVHAVHGAAGRPIDVRVSSQFRLRGTRLELLDLRAASRDAELAGRAVLELDRPSRIEAALDVRADLEALMRIVAPDAPAVAGRLSGTIDVARDPDSLRIQGPVALSGFRVGRIEISEARGRLHFEGGRASLGEATAALLGGTASGEIVLALDEPTRSEAALDVRDIDATELFALLGVPLPVLGRATGTVRLAGAPALRETWNGTGTFELTVGEPSDAGVPAAGHGQFVVDSGHLALTAPSVRTEDTEFALEAALDLATRGTPGTITLRGTTADAATTQRDVLRILHATGVSAPDLVSRTITGAGPLAARFTIGGSTEVDVDLDLTSGAWGPAEFDRARLQIASRPGGVEIRSLDVRVGAARLEGAIGFAAEPFSLRSIDLVAQDVDVAEVAAASGVATDLSGRATGTLHAVRGSGGLDGTGTIRLAEGAWLGEPFDEATARLRVRGETLGFEEIAVRGPAVTLEGAAEVDLVSGWIDARIGAGRIEVERLEAARAAELPVRASLSVHGPVRVDAQGARGVFELTSDDLALSDLSLGSIAGQLELRPEEIELHVSGVDPGGFRCTAIVGLAEPRPLRAELALDRLSLETPAQGDLALRLVTSGSFLATGPLDDPAAWDVRGTVDEAAIHVGARKYDVSPGVPVRVEGGVLAVGPIEIRGEGADLRGGLRYTLRTGEIDASLDGASELSVVALALPEFRGHGRVGLGVRVTGTLDAPRFAGSLRLDDGRLRHLGLPYVLQAATAEIALDGPTARISSLRGVLGGGEIEGSGTVELGRSGITEFDLVLHGTGVRLELPPGFDGVYDAQLAIRGSPEHILVGGDVTLLRGLWTSELESPQLFGPPVREYAAVESSELAARTFLDIDVHADGGVWVRNRLAEIESAVDLELGGTLERPQLTGRVFALEGGRIEYRGLRYQVRSGSLEFTDPDRIEPFVTVEADTSVSGYDIQLRASGTPDRLSYELSSSPALSQQDIIAVLATGRTFSDVEAGSSGSGEFTGDLAASYFAGVLTDPFEDQLASLVGLDTFRVDPLTIDRQDPTTRVTLGKEIRDDLTVLYSHRADQIEEDLYQVEWRADRRATVTAERATNGGIGANLYYTHRYWWRKPGAPGSVATPRPAGGTGSAAPRVGTIRIEVAAPGGPEPSELLPRLPLRTGDPYGRAGLHAGVEALRQALVRGGHLEAEVTAETVPSDAHVVDVVYRIRPGPRYLVEFEGVRPKEERKLRPMLESLWSDSLFVGDLYDDSLARIRSFFQGRGYFAVDVEYELVSGAEPVLRFRVDRGAEVQVARVILHGADEVGEERVRRQMLTRPAGLLGSRAFDPEVLEADRTAIRNLYRGLGYLSVSVDEPEIRLSMSGDAVDVTLRIDEGPRYTLRKLAFSDVPGVAPDQLSRWSGLEIGQPVSREAIADAEASLRRALDRDGRSAAEVRAVPTLATDGAADLRFEITAGPEMRVARVSIEGNFLTRDETILAALDIDVGDTVTQESLARAQRALYRLGTLQSVRIDHEPIGGPDDHSRVLRIRVTESRPLRLAVGAGYNTESKINFSLGTSFDNVAGRGRSIGTRVILNSELENFQLFGRSPRLFGSETPGLASLVWETDEQNPGFDVERWSVALRAEHRFDREWQGFVRYAYQLIDVYNIGDPVALQQEQLEDAKLGSVEGSLTFDSRDDPVAPTRGLRGSLGVAVFAEPFLSEFSYVRGTIELSRIWTFSHGLAFVTVARAGIEDRFGGTTDVPISERFFAGGSSTVRGFETDFLGPVSEGLPTGGEGLLVLNEELRFPIVGALRGVAFYDAGNVYRRLADYDPTELRHVLGLGVRFETPIGPLRAEYGWKLDREPGEEPGQFFFSIGNAF